MSDERKRATGRYLVHHTLGEGGMGVVHMGTLVSPAGERLVAIKELGKTLAVDGKARQRLIAEARLVFQLTHASICQVLDLGENQGGTFVVMEYVRGCDLRALLGTLRAEEKILEAAMVAYIGREVARALDYAHRRRDPSGRPLGLVHGDVTPQNILLSVEGEVKLADFGLARAIGTRCPGHGVLGGTPGFMAPELEAGAADSRADLYSLGVTLKYALSLAGPDRLAAEPGVADLIGILDRATAEQPADRQLSAGILERELSAWLARRYPDFTPIALARVVAPHARHVRQRRSFETKAEKPLAMKTLLEGATERDAPPEPPAGELQGGTLTATAGRRRPRYLSWTMLSGLLVAVVAGSGLTAWGLFRPPEMTLVVASDPVPAPTVAATPTSDPPPAVPEAAAARAASTPAPAEATRRRARRAELGYLTVNSRDWGAVYVDGKLVASETPLYRHPLRPGRHAVSIRWSRDEAASPARVVVIEPGRLLTIGINP